jgi:hypothetical protein
MLESDVVLEDGVSKQWTSLMCFTVHLFCVEILVVKKYILMKIDVFKNSGKLFSNFFLGIIVTGQQWWPPPRDEAPPYEETWKCVRSDR